MGTLEDLGATLTPLDGQTRSPEASLTLELFWGWGISKGRGRLGLPKLAVPGSWIWECVSACTCAYVLYVYVHKYIHIYICIYI